MICMLSIICDQLHYFNSRDINENLNNLIFYKIDRIQLYYIRYYFIFEFVK